MNTASYVFSARLRFPDVFVKMIKVLNEFVEYVNIEANNEGLSIETIDAAHVMFLQLELKDLFFDEYSCRGTGAVIGVSVKLLYDAVKNLHSADSVWIHATQDENILIKVRRGTTTKLLMSVTQVNILDDGLQSMPPHNYPCSIILPSVEWTQMCQHVAPFGDTVTIKINASSITLKAKSDVNKGVITIQPPAGVEDFKIICQEPHKESFNMQFIQRLAKVVRVCKVGNVLIELGPAAPMNMVLDSEGVCLTFYVAPIARE